MDVKKTEIWIKAENLLEPLLRGCWMILLDDVIESIRKRRIRITDEDEPYLSCLIYGKNIKDEPIHSVWAYNKETESAALITVYRPDPSKWIDWRIRREP